MLKTVTTSLLALLSFQAFAETNVIYGVDNRKDVYQVSNRLHLSLAGSTAGMIPNRVLRNAGSYDIYQILGRPTLAQAENLCANEAYASQPLAAACTGFLVGPDLLVTAGHCYGGRNDPTTMCRDFVWVFDYNMKSAGSNPTQNIPIDNIYSCAKIEAGALTADLDFAVIRLDRKVKNRRPLTLRKSGKISDSTSLLVIGHPSGLPSKIADGGTITDNSSENKFATSLDTFHGNSGSPVFDARSGQVEGILIQGKTDYVLSNPADKNSCKVVNRCNQDVSACLENTSGGVAKGEVVLRISILKDLIEGLLKN